MFCTACGTKNAAESRFCKQCGHELEKSTAGRVREEDFDRALPEEEQLNALLERAYRARKAGDNAQAIALCQEALQLRPDSTTSHSLLGQIYESIGERDMAIRAYERVVQLNPGSIADRVKLDELRGDDLPAMRGAAPHIVFTRSRGQQGGNQLLGAAALAAVLMLIGAGIAAGVSQVWRSHAAPSAPSVSAEGAGKSAQRGADASTGAQTANGAIGSGNASTQAGVLSAANDKSASTTPAAVPPYGYSPYPWSLPPTIIYTPSPARMVQPSAPINNERTANLAAVRMPGPRAGGGGRVVLAPDEQADDKGTINIQVGPKDTQKEPQKNGQKAADVAPFNPGKIVVTPSPPGTVADNSQSASFDARSYIATGNDYKVNGEYDKAISAYSHALGNAGDDRGSVYQMIAHCYQQKGDKTSAITNYRNAISEYHKLIDAGKQVETAQEGVNTCEKAIKACNY
jgi:tetratricopeptide (TPR) repeat protein